MAFKFEELQVWHKSLDLTVDVSLLASTFPKFELFSLSSQMRRAADSVALNIAEGRTGQSNVDFKRFIRYSLRSAIEVVSCLFIAKKKGYIDDEKFQSYYDQFELLCKRLNSLIARIGRNYAFPWTMDHRPWTNSYSPTAHTPHQYPFPGCV